MKKRVYETMSKIYEAIKESLGLDDEITECTTTLNDLIERESGSKREADHGDLMDILYRIGVNTSKLKDRFDQHRIIEKGVELLSIIPKDLGINAED